MKDRIYINQWLELKPYDTQTLTDHYYLKLSNKLKDILYAPDSFVLLMYIEKEEIDLFSCFLTSYFEDIISGTNIWNTFTRIHKKHYHKSLPFFGTKDYVKDEINVQDVSFLIWYFLNTIQDEKFISPFNNFITQIAEKVMEVFDEAYEYAPENYYLKSFYTLDKTETDFYIVRNLIDNLLFKTYLFFPDTAFELSERELELIEEYDDENILQYFQETRDNLLHTGHTRIMSLKGKEWVANLLGPKHPLSADLINMSQRIRGFFLYKGQNDTDIFIEHIASGKAFKLTKKSFDHSEMLKSTDTIMYLGIVEWQNEWWFSGVYFQNEFNADLILNEKNSLESRRQVNFLDHNRQETKETLEQQFNAFLDFNKGSQIAFLPSGKINEFFENYIKHYNASLKLSKKKIEEARKNSRADGYFGDEEKPIFDFTEDGDSGLVFFNPNSGIEIALNHNNVFPLSNNPYYNPGEENDEVLDLFISEQTSKELSEYCIKHCKSKLPFFKTKQGILYLKDIDFLLRFWKRSAYFSKPSITFTGQKD